ncbi:MAG: ankyrin repeat domain-containing protein [Candidatus Dependentiae bacterium]|nr:ankyrin repeat domain-containing protein [Candidatus Dependentiae bacterium]
MLEKLEASKRQALLEKFKASSQTSVKKNKIDKANNNLSISVIINDSEGVKDALKEGADVNTQDKDGMAALSWAAFKGHGQIVDLLLKNSTKIAINAQDKNGRTALCWADCRGHRKIVDLLLQYGANKLLLKSNGELGLNDEVRGKNSVSTLCQFCLVARGQSAGGAAGGSCVCGKNKKN